MSQISRRKLITGGIAAAAGISSVAVAATLAPASRTDSARLERRLRARRNVDLCGAAAVDPPFDGPGIFPE
jgi:hypothetical protein